MADTEDQSTPSTDSLSEFAQIEFNITLSRLAAQRLMINFFRSWEIADVRRPGRHGPALHSRKALNVIKCFLDSDSKKRFQKKLTTHS